MRMEEKMEEEKMGWKERMAKMQIEHEKQMMQMQSLQTPFKIPKQWRRISPHDQ